jgi:hypothetical protein
MVGAVFVIVGVLKVKDENPDSLVRGTNQRIRIRTKMSRFLTKLPPANGKQGAIPEEMSHTQRTNKKQGNLD